MSRVVPLGKLGFLFAAPGGVTLRLGKRAFIARRPGHHLRFDVQALGMRDIVVRVTGRWGWQLAMHGPAPAPLFASLTLFTPSFAGAPCAALAMALAWSVS